ncbi:MAG TPA: molecular chaperone DnaJ [Gemmatimonadales bacterium]|nr:molecular chaperone DnaJ [Gemmatimonadales bacterium]
MSDFYELFGVSRDAGEDEIKRAYRRLAMEYHPDRNPSADAATRFRQIAEAYEVLCDPEKRALYDRYGEAGLKSGMGGFHHINLAEALQIFMRDFGGLGGLGGLESLFGGGAPQTETRRGQDIRVGVKLSLQEVATGAKRTIKLKTLLRCESCGGSGGAVGTRPTPCSTCGGSGEVRRAARSVFGQFVSVAACPSCGGEGVIITHPCEGCRGEGRVKGERAVSVDIPAGVSSNNYITLRGQGAAGPRNGPNGDLLVMIEVKEDERFERVGDDLNFDLALSFSQAALGTSIKVPTPYGDERLAVPAGIQSGTVLRLKGKGLPRLGQHSTGDLNVRVHLWTPESLNPEQRRLLEEFSKIEGPPPKQSSGFWSRLKEALRA